MNTILKKVITAVITLLMVTGCASSDFNREVSKEEFRKGTPSLVGDRTMQAGTLCNKNPTGGSTIVTSTAVNPKGISAMVISGLSEWIGDDNCEYIHDANGHRIPAGKAGQSYAHSNDAVKDAMNGGIGVIGAGVNGLAAAKEMPGCSGGSCGSPVIVQTVTDVVTDVIVSEERCTDCRAPGE